VFLEMAIRAEGLSVPDRVACLEAAFQVLTHVAAMTPAETVGGAKPWWTQMQLFRSENLCVALYHALVNLSDEDILYLGRIGSHSVECHFGLVRSMLRGDDRLDRWYSAETKAVLVERLLSQLGQDPITRRSRVPISGVHVSGADREPSFHGALLVSAARSVAYGDEDSVGLLIGVLEGPLAHVQCPTPRQGVSSGSRPVERAFGPR
jgi:hypothetical protein